MIHTLLSWNAPPMEQELQLPGGPAKLCTGNRILANFAYSGFLLSV
jgi:hypothetical protein